MALILNIDTATTNASVCISNGTEILSLETSSDQKNHASFIQPAIKKVMEFVGISFNQLEAISVSGGPGSYTGLRVGLSTAKGLCYATGKRLIMVNTLEVMAFACIKTTQDADRFLYCPMIDARRMEVFTAIYNASLANIIAPSSVILEGDSFGDILAENTVIFFGNGSFKFSNIVSHQNALFSEVKHNASDLAVLASKYLEEERVANLAYSEPFYLKEFFSR